MSIDQFPEYRFNPLLTFVRAGIKGNICVQGLYCNDEKPDDLPRGKLFRWMVTRNPQREEKIADRWIPDVVSNDNFLHTNADLAVWLGHSSFFIRANGIQMLTDPVLFDPAPLLRKKHALPCSAQNFNNIDIILLSHGHRDHFDIPSLRLLLKQNPRVAVYCPMGIEKLLRSLGFKNVQEAAWWQKFDVVKDIEVIMLPARHWNRRTLFDYNRTLWGSFRVSFGGKSLYFAGDTAYGDHFKAISETFGSTDHCFMPIGAYKPSFVMKWAHVSPQEAFRAYTDLAAKYFVPMHYGTFDLADEPASEPPRLIKDIFSAAKQDDRLIMPAVGEVIHL